MSNKIIAIILLISVCLAGVFYFYNKDVVSVGPIACTQEAKLCPDGTAVGRTGLNCEFAECPITQIKKEVGIISGTVTTSPTCPVERMPPEPQCAPRPYATSINIREEGKQAIIKTIQSNNLGIFETDLPIGSYELDAITTNDSTLPRCNKVTVLVKSGQTTTEDISCDTGIR